MKLAVDAIIERDGKILLIERSHAPLGLALPGGMVEENESCESAIIRELKEETNLDTTDLTQMYAYSEPDRDPRCRVVSVVYVVEAIGEVTAGDDAKDFKWILLGDLTKEMVAFDHYEIIQDYINYCREDEEC